MYTKQEWSNYGPNLACQMRCTFYSNTTFLTVDSSATVLAAAYHVNRTVSSSGQAVVNSPLGVKSLTTKQ